MAFLDRFHSQQGDLANSSAWHSCRQRAAVAAGSGSLAHPVDQKDGLAIDAHVARIPERSGELPDMTDVVFCLNRSGGATTSLSRPFQLLVQCSLAQQRQKGKSGSPERKHLFEGPLQKLLTVEPIVVIAESTDSMATGKICLRHPGFRKSQVVEAKIGGKVGLRMFGKSGTCRRDIRPFRKALAPPGIILGNGMVLGKVEGNGANLHVFWAASFRRLS